MGVTSDSLDLYNIVIDSKDGHIQSSSTKIKYEDVAFTDNFVDKIVCSSRGCRCINGTNVHSHDGPSVYCGLPLRIIEVGRDTDDNVVYDASKVRFGS